MLILNRRDPRLIALAFAFCLGIAFIALAAIACGGALLPGDQAVSALIGHWRHPALDLPMRRLSDVGSGKVLIPLNVLLACILWRRRDRHSLMVPLTGVAGVSIEALTKWIVHRPRPKNVGYGFPSGHVVGAVIFFGLLVYLCWKAGHHRGWCVAATGGAGWAVMGIACSRLYLNAHWLSDILGGLCGGLALMIASIVWIGPARAYSE